MQKKIFGRIVFALRKEHFDPSTGRMWSQRYLAIEAGLTERIVGKIERGEQAYLDRDILQGLAQAFKLNPRERREMFAVANDMSGGADLHTEASHEEVLAKTRALLGKLHVPALIWDSYGDVMGANRALLDFHNVSMAQVNEAQTTDIGVNILDLLLAPNAPLRQSLGNGWRSIAYNAVQEWRVATLRIRHTSRFRQLSATFSNYPDFHKFWVAGGDLDETNNGYGHVCSFDYTHKIHGLVGYTVFTVVNHSPSGDLLLSIFVPHDSTTTTLFHELAGTNNPTLPLTSWPHRTLK